MYGIRITFSLCNLYTWSVFVKSSLSYLQDTYCLDLFVKCLEMPRVCAVLQVPFFVKILGQFSSLQKEEAVP